MGPNSFRNLTYAAVLAVVGALVYLVYQSSRNKQRHNASVENSTLGAYSDTLGSIAGSSSAAFSNDSVRNSQDGIIATGGASSPSSSSINSTLSSSDNTTGSSSASEVKEVTAEEPGSLSRSTKTSALSDEGIASSEKSTTVTAKGVKSPAAKTTNSAPKVKFDAGAAAGDFMAVAGSFASKDNAEALVAKLKKMGFSHAEAIKMENSANTYAVAGYYKFKGGAEAAVRTLKANKIPAIAKKKSGDIYKSAPVAPVKPVATPKSVTPVKAKPI